MLENIPLVNLKRMHEPIKDEIDSALQKVLKKNNYINGEEVQTFENHFASFLNCPHVIGVSSGTDALFLALRSINLKSGEKVITVPHTFIATTEAISMAGGRIVFLDSDEKTANMDPAQLESYLVQAGPDVLQSIKAIIFVLLYGNPAGLEKVHKISQQYNIKLIADASQAHGALINNSPITDYADIVTYSFFPGKNLGALGDAGAVATKDTNIAQKISILRNHGRRSKYYHEVEGFNCRMDTLQASVLDVKLNYLKEWNNHRLESAKLYNRLLLGKGYILPQIEGDYFHVFHLYVIRSNQRDRLCERLQKENIATGIHYPVPLHLQPAYNHLNLGVGDFPVCEKLSAEVLSLPIDGSISKDEIKRIASKLQIK